MTDNKGRWTQSCVNTCLHRHTAHLTDLVEPDSNRGIVKIYTTDAQRVEFGYMMTSDL